MGELEKKMNRKKNENGRSIVETLGVLAIMGILSLVGLYGYSNAMKRYQANDLLNEANKRAVIVSMDIAAGGILSDKASENVGVLSEFTDSSNERFTVSRKNKDQFDINIADVPKDVCEQMKTGLGPVVRGISPCPEEGNGDVALTFNNDMSAAKKAGDYDGDKSACEEAGNTYCEDSDTCVAPGETCPSDNLGCPAQAPETGLGGHATTLSDGTMCYCKEKDTIYQDGTCQPKPENCSSYRDCNRGEYCQFNHLIAMDAPICEPLSTCGSGKTYTATDGKTFWMDTDNPEGGCITDWYTAEDICHAKGMQMVSLEDLRCDSKNCDEDYIIALSENLSDEIVWTTALKSLKYAFSVLLESDPVVDKRRRKSQMETVLCRSKASNEISVTKKPEDYNGNESACTASGYIYCQSNDKCIGSGTCPSYDSGCPAKTSETGFGGHAVTLSNGTMCYCETENTVYQDGVCQTKPENCSSYRDCNKGEYCQFSPYACNVEPSQGICRSLSYCGDAGTYTADDGKTFWASYYDLPCSINWWTARDICQAKGMRMVSLADVKCNSTACSGDYMAIIDNNLNGYTYWTSDLGLECQACIMPFDTSVNAVTQETLSDEAEAFCVSK